MTLDDFMTGLRAAGGVTETGASAAEIEAWHRRHPEVDLPADLLDLYRRTDGFRIRPDADTPTGHMRLLPLREVARAVDVVYGGSEDVDLPEAWLGLMEDADGTVFVILDSAAGVYLEVDPIDPRDASEIGGTVEPLLTWTTRFF